MMQVMPREIHPSLGVVVRCCVQRISLNVIVEMLCPENIPEAVLVMFMNLVVFVVVGGLVAVIVLMVLLLFVSFLLKLVVDSGVQIDVG